MNSSFTDIWGESNALSPHVRESKTILDSEFHVVDPRFQSLVAFRISLSYIPDSKAQDPYSTSKISSFPATINKNIPGIPDLDSLA